MKPWLELALMGGTVLRKRQIERFLSGMAIMPLLAVLMGAALTGLATLGLIFLYRALLAHGLAEQPALLIIMAVLALFTGILCLVAFFRLRSMKRELRSYPSQAVSVIEAFLDGLLNDPQR